MNSFRPIAATTITLATLVLSVSISLGFLSFAIVVGIGGLAGIGNLYLWKKVVVESIRGKSLPRPRRILVYFLLKTVAFYLLLFVALVYLHLDPAGLMLGFSLFIVALLLNTFRERIRSPS